MKWSVVGLFVLGVLAAVASVVLMITLRPATAQPRDDGPTAPLVEEHRSTQVLVAASDLGIRSVIDAEDVSIQTVDASSAPHESLSDPVQVVGRVLVVPMVLGQAFTPQCFATDDSGLLLATALVPGSRAVSLALSDDMGIEKLLFPGCMVDVIATIEMESSSLGKYPISFTLLERVMVLAVGERSIVDGEAEDDGSLSSRDRPPVTLLLDAEQAELVKLAIEKGSVSISMRNPMDDSMSPSDGKSLASLSPVLAEAERRAAEAAAKRAAEDREKREYEMERERLAIEKARDEADLARLAYEQQKRTLEKEESRVEAWEVTVLRGSTSQTQSFTAPRNGDDR